MTSPFRPDPIGGWLDKYFQDLQAAHSPAAADATGTGPRGRPTLPTRTVGPQGVRSAPITGGVPGAILGLGERAHNAIVSRAKGYSASDALRDIGEQTGASDVAQGLKNADPGAVGAGLAAGLPFLLPEGALAKVGAATKGMRGKLADLIAPELATERRALGRAANSDALTGLGNQGAFHSVLDAAEKDPNKHIIRFDLNGFKAVNDQLGHQAGDDALRDVATAIRQGAPGLPAFRVGGDEFAVIAPKDQAPAVRDAIEQHVGVRSPNGVKYSISGGIGNTNAKADAAAISRKADQKQAQGIAPRAMSDTLAGRFTDPFLKQYLEQDRNPTLPSGAKASDWQDPRFRKAWGQANGILPEADTVVTSAARAAAKPAVPGVPNRFAILTAENAGGKQMSSVENTMRNAALEKELTDRGFNFTPVKGRYKDNTTGQVLNENSYLVHDMPEREAKLVAKRYGQNGVISHNGYHDLVSGQTFPSKGIGPTTDLPYTQLPGGQKFALDIDWDNPAASPVNTLPVPKNANPEVMRIAEEYRKQSGVGGNTLPPVTAVDPDKARAMAQTYENLKNAPDSPDVRNAYDQLNREVDAQYNAIKRAGYNIQFVDQDAYKNSREMMDDLSKNRTLKVLKTNAESAHPLLTPEQNDKFRAVHDFFGHAQSGNQFGPKGEEGAYRDHSSMFGDVARRAMATETRGQNSWVNFGPNSDLPVTERPFAEQKAALWPEGLLGDYSDMPSPGSSEPNAPTVITKPNSGNVFDTSKLGTVIPAGVTTDRPPVRYPTARANTSMLDGISRRFRDVYTPNALKGLAENPEAAGWYDMTQARDAMRDAMPNGDQAFRDWMMFMGPTSSGTKVPENLRHASYFSFLTRNGSFDKDSFLEALRNGTLDLPKGYANRRQKSVNAGIAKILETGDLDPYTQPKTYRYAHALAGDNWGGTALDMHVGRQVGKQGLLFDPATDAWDEPGRGFPTSAYTIGSPKISTSPDNLHYPLIEDPAIKEAGKLGVAPTQYQSLGWVGGASQTGVADKRPLLEILNDKLRSTAKQYGYDRPLDAWNAFLQGKNPLYALPFLAGGAATASTNDRDQ